jgi:hypothetical protein
MAPTYIDFVYFCLFTCTIALLFRKFCHSNMSEMDKERLLEKLTGFSHRFMQLMSVGYIAVLLMSFYNGFILYITHKSFFKVVAFFISQFNF